MRKSLVALLISASVFVLSVSLYHFGITDRLEYFVFDGFERMLRKDAPPPDKVKVILIDEASLKAMEPIAGRWPWPRAVWADLLEFLSIGGARAVLFDVLFTERQAGFNDDTLVKATGSSGNVYHSMMVLRENDTSSPDLGRPMPPDFVKRFSLNRVEGRPYVAPGTENNNFYLPFKDLYEASKGISVVEFSPDSDGAFRRTKPIREYNGRYFPVLGLAPFMGPDTEIKAGDGSIDVGGTRIPVDGEGNAIIHMYGAVSAYSIGGIFASLQKIREGDVEGLMVDPEEFRDSIVYVGGSAVGVEDLKSTPIAPRTPGVMLHLSLAGNYLTGDFLRPPNKTLSIILALAGAVLTTCFVLFSKRFLFRSIFPIAVLGIFGGASFLSFRAGGVVEIIPFTIAALSGSFLSFGYLTFTEARDKRKVSRVFSQYVSKDVLDEIMRRGSGNVKTSGSKVDVSILFTDIRGFTTFSENTPPERIVEMLNCFFSSMADIILKHKGTLDKYIGDAIMAFWGAPVPDEDHALNAVTAALGMLEALKGVNATLKEKGYEGFELKIGIGINTGSATIGNIGSEKKLNYTVVGDTVNLASRLESLTKDYDTGLIISEYTFERIKDKIPCVPLGNVKVKGREKPVWIYTPEVLAPERAPDPDGVLE